ncbi:uncharacterized protein CLUP02_07680 [Colletotrichum lupini]|uniref:Uncharacterized protein n=1 Tax=Colletotrichum lupini TaxID=145971 RepID=A0A9Q8WFW8_9PEZI|nr:uncharacterized protein CLUP02_07680 [Colletotrichum lupini]UQC82193.1 hypothetical protein CLUP02_07680 [Colletotrichum lupini]
MEKNSYPPQRVNNTQSSPTEGRLKQRSNSLTDPATSTGDSREIGVVVFLIPTMFAVFPVSTVPQQNNLVHPGWVRTPQSFSTGPACPPTSERIWNPRRERKKALFPTGLVSDEREGGERSEPGALGRGTRGGMKSVERANVGEFDLFSPQLHLPANKNLHGILEGKDKRTSGAPELFSFFAFFCRSRTPFFPSGTSVACGAYKFNDQIGGADDGNREPACLPTDISSSSTVPPTVYYIRREQGVAAAVVVVILSASLLLSPQPGIMADCKPHGTARELHCKNDGGKGRQGGYSGRPSRSGVELRNLRRSAPAGLFFMGINNL